MAGDGRTKVVQSWPKLRDFIAQNFDWKSLLEPYSWPTIWANPVQLSFSREQRRRKPQAPAMANLLEHRELRQHGVQLLTVRRVLRAALASACSCDERVAVVSIGCMLGRAME
jgi:hypothetical protein